MNLLYKIRLYFYRFRENRLVQNVITVSTGVAAAQAISLAFTPFLTRLYEPEAFGALAAFTAVVNIITPLSTLGFSNAVVMTSSEEGASTVARLSLFCAALVVPIVLVFILLFESQIARWTGLEDRPVFLYLIPVSLFLVALLSVANQVAIREGLFSSKSVSFVASSLLMNVSKLTLGFLTPSGLILILISMLGNSLNFLILLAIVPLKGSFNIRGWFGTAGILQAAKEHRDFFLFRMPQSIINSVAFGLPVILLTSYFGLESAGQYSMTTLILGAPILLLGQAVSEVFFPKITSKIRNDPAFMSSLLKRASFVMAALSILLFCPITVAGDLVLPFILGSSWERAGVFSQWVSISMVTLLASRPAVAAIPALKLQGTLLVYEILITCARVGALLLGARFGNDVTAVAAFSLVNFVGYMILLLYVLIHARGYSQMATYTNLVKDRTC